ncbi:threonine-phosphate decarboxylase [Peptostreptococcus russellii]|uniref:Threonine-phosphate decarboxylase n=1 Tax=Peptostreptococcus russellii TaxID=215200 RepID=A0A1H8GX66_9FIRM|nr:aminotransferase class I/II-fold pyridoxal phosphate-dependent enzyme [Peptostreptococcus russellii]SEN48400.1 threonine-phosphate decarboxylase [Peptostreptococcus russellii]
MFKHGADLEKIRRKYHFKGELVDFSSNINPFTPENTVINIIDDIEELRRYPDIEYIELRNSIADHIMEDNDKCDFFFNQENICVGNGATELVYLLMRTIKGKIGVICPTFSEYRRAASIVGRRHVEIQMFQTEDGFEYPDFTKPEMDIYKDIEALFICNPNNPDGKLRNLDKVVEFCQKNCIKLVVDETFIEFCEDYKDYTALNYSYQNIYVLRAITKFYGLPGIRLGYLVTKNSSYVDELFKLKEPWTVNSIASHLGVDLLKDKKFSEYSRKFYKDEREFLTKSLEEIPNLKVFKTDSAFMLVKIDDSVGMSARDLKKKLIFDYGIVIRDASNFLGLNSKYFRIAVKRHRDNLLLIESLSEIFDV